MFLGGPVIWVYAVEFGLGRVDSDESVCTFRSKEYPTCHVPCGVELDSLDQNLLWQSAITITPPIMSTEANTVLSG